MDAARRITQNKTTKGWLNPPYSRFGCLRIRRRIRTDRDSTKEMKTQPSKQVASAYILILRLLFFLIDSDILPLGSVRLEIRRVSGKIRKNQVHWEKGDDDNDDGVYVFDSDGIKVIDDAALEKPPYINFEFKFREDPKITRLTYRIAEENEDSKLGVRVTRKSSKSGALALPAIGTAEGTSFHVRAHYGSSLIGIQAFQI